MKVGFFGLLGLLFIGLKLAGTITWSWFWVLSPFWGGFIFYFFFGVLLGIAAISQNK